MGHTFSSEQRAGNIRRMAEEPADLLVIGGGITGTGIALDAQTRGLRTYLVDMQDFAAGTSSRSTKLVHGGLRYLKQLEIGVVAEVGKERAIVYENGPHVTTPEWMLLPFYEGGTFGKLTTSLGLRVYDFLAGVKKKERRMMLSPRETLSKEPLLKREGLKGGGYYVEYRTDDARLTIEVLKKAAEHGALAANYAKVEDLLYEEGKVSGVRLTDKLTGEQHHIRARKIVNAAGPWVDVLRELDHSREGKTLHLTKGVHLVFDQGRFPLRQAIYFDTPDGRMIFAIPREGKAYVGTTDTNDRGDREHPRMSRSDRDYLLRAVNDMFPSLQLTEADVESSWAGLRPLIHQEGKDPSEISRRDEIFESASGLISMAGGKLTGYRKMAETVVDKVAAELVREGTVSDISPCRTRTMPISGGGTEGSAGMEAYLFLKIVEGRELSLIPDEAEELARRYGTNADEVYDRIRTGGEEARKYGLPLSLLASLKYSVEEEMVVKPEDYFIRRTGALFFNRAWVIRWLEPATAYLADRFGWSSETAQRYMDDLLKEVQAAIEPITE